MTDADIIREALENLGPCDDPKDNPHVEVWCITHRQKRCHVNEEKAAALAALDRMKDAAVGHMVCEQNMDAENARLRESDDQRNNRLSKENAHLREENAEARKAFRVVDKNFRKAVEEMGRYQAALREVVDFKENDFSLRVLTIARRALGEEA